MRFLVLGLFLMLTACGAEKTSRDTFSGGTTEVEPTPSATPAPVPPRRQSCPTTSTLYLNLQREECGGSSMIYSGTYRLCTCKLTWAFNNFSCSDLSADYQAIEAIGISEGVESRCRSGL